MPDCSVCCLEIVRITHFSLCICVYEGREWINVTILLSSHMRYKQDMMKWYLNTNAWFDNHLTDETGESIHLAATRLSGIELMFLFLYSARIYLIYNICLQLVNSSYCLHEPHVDIIDFHNTRLCVNVPCLQFSPFQQYNNTLLHTLTLFLFYYHHFISTSFHLIDVCSVVHQGGNKPCVR